jgi:hypothetical protein
MRRKIFSIWSILLVLVVSIGVLVPGCGGGGGTIEVNATFDGSPWSGSVDYTLTPGSGSPISGTSVPGSHSADAGNWTCSYHGGGPPGAMLVGITPDPTQELSDGETITFTLNFGPEEVDASITWVSWTIDGDQVSPGSYTVYPPTIIDCEYDVVINGTYCESVNVTVSLELKYHYGGPNDFKSWHVANAPGSIYTIPPGTISSQNCSVDGVSRPACYSFDVSKCQNVTLGVTFTYEAHKGTTYRVGVNWLGYKGSGPDNILFDNIIEWAGCLGDSDMVTSGCVYVDEDVDPANDCSGDSPMLYIKHDYQCP